MKVLILVSAFIFTSTSWARDWVPYAIPGAECGNGDPYRIFISLGTVDKVTLAFQDGGACWSLDSCFGLIKAADLSAPKKVNKSAGIYSLKPERSPAHDHTMVYFPYCTGDVFAGTHIATYDSEQVSHVGGTNVRLSLNYLSTNHWPLFNSSKEIIVYGASAGALGALMHIREIDRIFGAIPKKSLILDSPGLHYGPNFWHKFSPELVNDYSSALISVGLSFDYNNGLIVSVIPAICSMLNDWRVGVLQGTRDRVMSIVFGNISMSNHETLVLGEDGIYELTKNPKDNCSAWVPSTGRHTFLDTNTKNPMAGNQTAVGFAYEVVGTSKQLNYK